MKRWAVLTVALYAFVLLVLSAPVMLACAAQYRGPQEAHSELVSAGDGSKPVAREVPARPGGWEFPWDADDLQRVYQEWAFWIVLAVLLAGQALLLLVPIGVAERRPVPRRSLVLSVGAGTFFFTLLFLAAGGSLILGIWGDDAPDWMESTADSATGKDSLRWILDGLSLSPGSDVLDFLRGAGAFLFFWMLWALVFHRFARRDPPEDMLRRLTRWLLRGSILELLVAVPSHIAARRRDDCCAPAGTSAGILTGIAVMLLAFGPGVFYLYVARMRRLRPGEAPPDPPAEPPPGP